MTVNPLSKRTVILKIRIQTNGCMVRFEQCTYTLLVNEVTDRYAGEAMGYYPYQFSGLSYFGCEVVEIERFACEVPGQLVATRTKEVRSVPNFVGTRRKQQHQFVRAGSVAADR